MPSLHRVVLITIGLLGIAACAPPVSDASAEQAVLRDGANAAP